MTTSSAKLEEQIEGLRTEIAILRAAFTTLIVWMSASANSPISRQEAELLMRKAEGSMD